MISYRHADYEDFERNMKIIEDSPPVSMRIWTNIWWHRKNWGSCDGLNSLEIEFDEKAHEGWHLVPKEKSGGVAYRYQERAVENTSTAVLNDFIENNKQASMSETNSQVESFLVNLISTFNIKMPDGGIPEVKHEKTDHGDGIIQHSWSIVGELP